MNLRQGEPGRIPGFGRQALLQKAEEQLPEMLLSLTAALRAGLSLRQALEMAAVDTPAPLGVELRRCLDQVRLGASWEEALERLRQRLPAEGLILFGWALSVHWRTGGDLPALCERLVDLLGERRRLRAKLAAATAQGRLSAGVVLLVPFLLAFSLRQLAPGYLAPLLTTPAGWAMLSWAGLMNCLGVVLILRMSTLKW